MAVFSPTILVNTSSPPLVVTIADPGVPGVTYDQVKNSLGQYVYLVQGFYVYSNTLNQLIGAINYNRYESDGNQDITNIITTVDPYQDANSIVVDLEKFCTDVVFNGNSSVSFTVLGNATLQLKLYCRRIENSFGRHLNNFKDIEFMDFKPDFFDNYGNRSSIAAANGYAQDTASMGYLPLVPDYELSIGVPKPECSVPEVKVVKREEKIIDPEKDKIPVMFLAVAAISLGALMISRK